MIFSLHAPNDFVLVGQFFHYNGNVYRYEMIDRIVDNPGFIEQINKLVNEGLLRQIDKQWLNHEDYRVRLLMAHNLNGLEHLSNDPYDAVRNLANTYLPLVECA